MEAQIAELKKEKDDALAEAKENAEKALELTEEAFNNGMDQVLALNPRVDLCTKEIKSELHCSRQELGPVHQQ